MTVGPCTAPHQLWQTSKVLLTNTPESRIWKIYHSRLAKVLVRGGILHRFAPPRNKLYLTRFQDN